MRLAYDNNPNIIELLFTPLHYENVIVQTDIWKLLHLNRFLVLSQQMRVKSLGFAFSELKRIERKRTSEDPFDYDGKAASHCLRLLDQCVQVLEYGDFSPRVALDRREHLKAIKASKVNFALVYEEIEDKLQEVKDKNARNLPEKGDFEKWNRLALTIYQGAYLI
jgi:hypothetical protein